MKVVTVAGIIDVGPVANDVIDVDKAALAALPLAEFHRGYTIEVIDTLDEAELFVEEIWAQIFSGKCSFIDRSGRTVSAIGFDTETRPQFQAGQASNKIALIQIATRDVVYLFRISKLRRVPDPLIALLSSRQVFKVGVGCAHDATALRSRIPLFQDNSSFLNLETLLSAKFQSLTRLGLRPSTAAVLGFRLSKGEQLANWERGTLTDKMIRYAANDAIVGVKLLAAVLSTFFDLSDTWSPDDSENVVLDFSCKACDRSFDTKRMFDQHQVSLKHLERMGVKTPRTSAEITSRHQCRECQRSFKSEFAMQAHEEDVHATATPGFTCVTCESAYGHSKVFHSEKALSAHRKALHDFTPALPCGLCQSDFQFETEFIQHVHQVHKPSIVRVETNGKHPSSAFRCPFCEHAMQHSNGFRSQKKLKLFFSSHNLNEHILSKHRNPPTAAPSPSFSSSSSSHPSMPSHFASNRKRKRSRSFSKNNNHPSRRTKKQ